MNQKIKLGATVRCHITGFAGIVTGYVQYITGCNQCQVAPPAKEGKMGEACWLDENRLIVDETIPLVTIDTAVSNGACEAPPIR